jgi:hypothetical protein
VNRRRRRRSRRRRRRRRTTTTTILLGVSFRVSLSWVHLDTQFLQSPDSSLVCPSFL